MTSDAPKSSGASDTDKITQLITQLITRFLTTVSFAKGLAPDYTSLPDLFVTGAQLIRNSGEQPEIATVSEFIHARLSHVSSGLSWFSEAELDHDTDIFGRVGHRFTTYRKQGEDSTGVFDVRGRISTQVIDTPDGWQISAMAWDDERPGLTLGGAWANSSDESRARTQRAADTLVS